MNKKKFFYKKPTAMVVEVKQQQHLLQASLRGEVDVSMDGEFLEVDIDIEDEIDLQ